MRVSERILEDTSRLATALGTDLADNVNVVRMAGLAERPLARLGYVTPIDHHRLLVTSIEQNIMLRQARYDSLENVMQQLINQRDSFGGVDINEEAAKLLIFEQMFQAMARFMQIEQKSFQTLLDIL